MDARLRPCLHCTAIRSIACLMIEGQEGVTWQDWVRLARLVEDHGLEGLFRSDDYTVIIRPQAGALDAWTTLAGLAAITERIRLGTLVSPATFRHPSVLARMAVTVDHISGGRVDVGMGAGWYEREHSEHGFPFLDPRQRFRLFAEQVEIVVLDRGRVRPQRAGVPTSRADGAAAPRSEASSTARPRRHRQAPASPRLPLASPTRSTRSAPRTTSSGSGRSASITRAPMRDATLPRSASR